MTTELQTTDLEFVPVPAVEVTIAYVLYTNDGVCVMQEQQAWMWHLRVAG